mmetsp:Transcript_131473/g.227710  ORF Transcript_131473/g.227710 Transcript_131473/m.227710 type:complete len:342 (+) Transcript_131473:198-1223(+)
MRGGRSLHSLADGAAAEVLRVPLLGPDGVEPQLLHLPVPVAAVGQLRVVHDHGLRAGEPDLLGGPLAAVLVVDLGVVLVPARPVRHHLVGRRPLADRFDGGVLDAAVRHAPLVEHQLAALVRVHPAPVRLLRVVDRLGGGDGQPQLVRGPFTARLHVDRVDEEGRIAARLLHFDVGRGSVANAATECVIWTLLDIPIGIENQQLRLLVPVATLWPVGVDHIPRFHFRQSKRFCHSFASLLTLNHERWVPTCREGHHLCRWNSYGCRGSSWVVCGMRCLLLGFFGRLLCRCRLSRLLCCLLGRLLCCLLGRLLCCLLGFLSRLFCFLCLLLFVLLCLRGKTF